MVTPNTQQPNSGGVDKSADGASLKPMRRVSAILMGAGLLLAGQAGAAPQVGVVSTSWELDLAFHDPQRISVRLPGDARETTFWYLLYSVTNDAGRDVEFYPTFDIVTDKLDVIEGGYGISPSVYDAIKARHKKVYPFFVDPKRVFGSLLQGEDNAVTSAVAFKRLPPEVNGFTVFIGGLSGEIVKVVNRTFDAKLPESKDNQRVFTLRKSLAISYDIPGDVQTRRQATPVRTKQEWVLR